jgi:peptidoglycan/LPS O-acetylase OafA/YrhL
MRGLAVDNPSRFDYRLDFIRFLCFFFVFICHFINNGGNGLTRNLDVWWNQELIQRISNFGREGVTLFFVLSGFLLWKLLIYEFKSTGKISIRKFLLRRIYRIWPLYFLFLIILFLINLVTNQKGFKTSEIPYLLTFTYNWGLALKDLGGTVASITWSLSIEEQIYLVLPLLSLIKIRNKFLFGSIIFFISGSISLIFCQIQSIDSLYLTSSYLVPFSIGMFIADKEKWFRVISMKYSLLTITSFFFILLYPFCYIYVQQLDSEIIQFYLSPIFFVCLLHICDKFLRENTLTVFVANFGRISYGCYLYHFIILFVFIRFSIFYDQNGFSIFGVLSALITTCLVSYFSYYYFEVFFLNKRLKYRA